MSITSKKDDQAAIDARTLKDIKLSFWRVLPEHNARNSENHTLCVVSFSPEERSRIRRWVKEHCEDGYVSPVFREPQNDPILGEYEDCEMSIVLKTETDFEKCYEMLKSIPARNALVRTSNVKAVMELVAHASPRVIEPIEWPADTNVYQHIIAYCDDVLTDEDRMLVRLTA